MRSLGAIGMVDHRSAPPLNPEARAGRDCPSGVCNMATLSLGVNGKMQTVQNNYLPRRSCRPIRQRCCIMGRGEALKPVSDVGRYCVAAGAPGACGSRGRLGGWPD